MINTDPDTRMWSSKGIEMTRVVIGKCPKASERRRKLSAWLDQHTEGEYAITPWLIGFEVASDALVFQLAYDHD